MVPYPVVLLGSPENIPGLDDALTQSTAKLVGRFPDLRAVRTARLDAAEPVTFLVRLRCEEDLVQLRLLSDAFPGEPIIGLVEGDCDASNLLRMNRAGATQLVIVPLVTGDLTVALDRVARQFGRIPPLGRVITFCSVIGGAGATMLAVNLAHELSIRWSKVCLIAEPAIPFWRLASQLSLKTSRPSDELYYGRQDPDLTLLQKSITPVADRLNAIVAPTPTLPLRHCGTPRLNAILESCRQISEAVLLDLPAAFDESCLNLIDRSDDVIFVANTTLHGLH